MNKISYLVIIKLTNNELGVIIMSSLFQTYVPVPSRISCGSFINSAARYT